MFSALYFNCFLTEPPAAPITLETDADIHTAQLRWTVPTPAPLSCTVFFLNLTESEDSRGSGRVVSWIRQEAQGLSSTQLKGLAPYSQYQVLRRYISNTSQMSQKVVVT